MEDVEEPFGVPVAWDPWSGFVPPLRPRTRDRPPGMRRVARGLYVPAGTAQSPQQRALQTLPHVPEFGGLTGWAALALLTGSPWFTGENARGEHVPVTIATNCRGFRDQESHQSRRERLARHELMRWRAIPMTVPVRSVAHDIRYAATLEEAVRVADMAAYTDVVSLDELATYAENMNGWTGVQRLRDALSLAVENAWSPRETDVRLVWERSAELPRPRSNQPIFDLDGRHIATPDLLDPHVGLAVEYDGPHHLDPSRVDADRRRVDRMRSVGLDVVVLTASDLSDRPRLVDLLRAHHLQARRAVRALQYDLSPPSGWILTDTVVARRALTREGSSAWLRYRRAG